MAYRVVGVVRLCDCHADARLSISSAGLFLVIMLRSFCLYKLIWSFLIFFTFCGRHSR